MRIKPHLMLNRHGLWEIRWRERVNGVWRVRGKSIGTTDLPTAKKALARFGTPLGARAVPRVTVRMLYIAFVARTKPEAGLVRRLRAPLCAFGRDDPALIKRRDLDLYAERRIRGSFSTRPWHAATRWAARQEIRALKELIGWATANTLPVPRQILLRPRRSIKGHGSS